MDLSETPAPRVRDPHDSCMVSRTMRSRRIEAWARLFGLLLVAVVLLFSTKGHGASIGDAAAVDAGPALVVPAPDGAAPASQPTLRDGGPDEAVHEPSAVQSAHTEVQKAPVPEPMAPGSVKPPTPSPSASVTVASAKDGAPVRLRDRKLFVLRVGRGGLSPEERARKASLALDAAFDKGLAGEVTIEAPSPDVATIVLDGTPIVQLGLDDAVAASDASLSVHAVATAELVRGAVKSERTRRDVATTVFHWSLVVFTGLLGFLVQRRLRRLLRAARIWLRRHPEKIPAFRVARIDLVRPTALLGLLQLTAAFLDRVVQGTVLYVWLVFSLSLFEQTQGASSTISGFVVKPLGAFAGRVASSLPSLFALFVAFLLLGIVVRFVGQVEKTVERGEAELPGLSRDLAKPVLVLVRLSIVLFALLVGAPVVTGSEDAVFSRVGLALVGALALSSAPLLASGAVGMLALFSGRYRVGEYISFDGRQGRVVSVSVLELRLRDGEGAELRIPHLLALVRDVRVLGPYRLATFEVVVDATSDLEQVRTLLVNAARSRHGDPRVRLLGMHVKGARFEIVSRRADDEGDAATTVAKALRDAGIGFGEVA